MNLLLYMQMSALVDSRVSQSIPADVIAIRRKKYESVIALTKSQKCIISSNQIEEDERLAIELQKQLNDEVPIADTIRPCIPDTVERLI